MMSDLSSLAVTATGSIEDLWKYESIQIMTSTVLNKITCILNTGEFNYGTS